MFRWMTLIEPNNHFSNLCLNVCGSLLRVEIYYKKSLIACSVSDVLLMWALVNLKVCCSVLFQGPSVLFQGPIHVGWIFSEVVVTLDTSDHSNFHCPHQTLWQVIMTNCTCQWRLDSPQGEGQTCRCKTYVGGTCTPKYSRLDLVLCDT